jgi:hypothetical protein
MESILPVLERVQNGPLSILMSGANVIKMLTLNMNKIKIERGVKQQSVGAVTRMLI